MLKKKVVDLKVKVAPPNIVPPRKSMSHESLSIIGIPRKFHDTTLEDFETYDSKGLESLKTFIEEYLSQIKTRSRSDYQEGIIFYGSNGVGKTMLSSIILREAYKYRFTSQRTTFVKYVDSYTSSWSGDKVEDDFWNICKTSQYLVLEEVGKEIDSKITKPILEDLLRYREEKGLVTIMCTNLSPRDLEDIYGASIMSLIKGNMTPVKMTGKDRRYED